MTTSEPYQTTPPAPQKTNTLAIVGFICSFFLALVGTILGFISLSQIKNSNGAEGGKGLAIAAIIIGLIPTVVIIILLILAPIIGGVFNSVSSAL